jgi:hypothetical protein
MQTISLGWSSTWKLARTAAVHSRVADPQSGSLQGYLLEVRCPDHWSSAGMAGSRLTPSQPVSCVLTMKPAQPQQVRSRMASRD